MKSIICLVFCLSIAPLFGQNNNVYTQNNITRIAFGSCAHQDKDIPIFDLIAQKRPDLFIFLGDNIYGDTEDMNLMREKYDKLKSKASYQNLKSVTKIIGTWDDHDYGANDAGKYYPKKKESKELLLDFLEEESSSERRNHDGVYVNYSWTFFGKTVQVILLDTRTFRSNLLPYSGNVDKDKRYDYELDYSPHTSGDSTMLGEAQWKWLEGALKEKADIRIIGSSTQFGIEFNGYEAWANFPHEQQKMVDLIKQTQANGIVFISGDVHYGELSYNLFPGLYPIYDLTSSGLTQTWKFATPNNQRMEEAVMQNNFGMITINWNYADPRINLQIIDLEDHVRINRKLKLSDISFK